MNNQLKAYEVREPDEGRCVVVFARSGVIARREGAADLMCEFEDVESCNRRPEFDVHAPGPVPLNVLLKAGWWFTCQGCSREFEEEGFRGEEDDEIAQGFAPLEDAKNRHYCCPACMMSEWQSRRKADAQTDAAIELLLSKFPQAVTVWAHRGKEGDADRPDVFTFVLPGLTSPAKWVRGASHVTVFEQDADAFKRLYGKL